ncbi:hypothetical protein C8R44DRAFT_731536 [Mycena epipterygia]|nr:hypothetical protein C8R44DRAFT_731536 [Mycena epipterygia]
MPCTHIETELVALDSTTCRHNSPGVERSTPYHRIWHSSFDGELLIYQGIFHPYINAPDLESRFYRMAGTYYHHHKKDIATARASFEKSLSLAKLCGNKVQELMALNYKAILEGIIGQFPAAQKHSREAQELAQESANPYLQAFTLQSEVLAVVALGKLQQENPYLKLLSTLTIAKINIMTGTDLFNVAQNLERANKGHTLAAKKMFQHCLDNAWGNDYEVVSYCLERLADAGHWTSIEINWTYTWTVIYLVQSHKTKEKLALYKALRCMGDDIFLSEGDEESAHSVSIVALEGFTSMDIHRSRAECMLRLGDIAKHRGNLLEAQELWKAAHPLFESS